MLGYGGQDDGDLFLEVIGGSLSLTFTSRGEKVPSEKSGEDALVFFVAATRGGGGGGGKVFSSHARISDPG
jgi:hypothetical protein